MRTNVLQVREKIEKAARASGRNPNDITLIAVSKTRAIADIQRAIDCGILDFGENKVQELQQKVPELPNVNWHMIGSLQTNKVKYIVDKISLLHSLDRLSLAKEVDKRAKQKNIIVKSLIQVNVSGELSKHGLNPTEVLDFCDIISDYSNIKVLGLMTIAPQTNNPSEVREVFRALRELRDSLFNKVPKSISLKDLSMGMSGDYEQAIMEGATYVRVGTKIFGDRIYKER
ncbi:YggS family pyridoxal phosphate-dependent enzyme [Clostridium sp. 'deep sea']|uniref:YggS family pyridoxal phosphate-dependent enzyme n=1 Tax=Clostridium sp. 'deep sea' TaxID=2779445 RepID=UPI0018964571|nr:YggS family pyridoxal phosphate-dependent enzyme [Clostridium sp. 'deep sea']QOR36205.1 YggS family pyridoxal phosphate-dependent enzyme [Clostridium sp. 'deep sea']